VNGDTFYVFFLFFYFYFFCIRKSTAWEDTPPNDRFRPFKGHYRNFGLGFWSFVGFRAVQAAANAARGETTMTLKRCSLAGIRTSGLGVCFALPRPHLFFLFMYFFFAIRFQGSAISRCILGSSSRVATTRSTNRGPSIDRWLPPCARFVSSSVISVLSICSKCTFWFATAQFATVCVYEKLKGEGIFTPLTNDRLASALTSSSVCSLFEAYFWARKVWV